MTILGLGLDLGSTTAKYAVVDENGSILESEYRRHGSDARNTALSLLQGLQNKYPKALFRLMLTGSAALDLTSSTDANFVQEVIASSKAVRKYFPDTDVAIDLGGEDAKVLYLRNGIEMRMNEVCAGGTGAFLDQMATLLETTTEGLDQLAKNAKTLYPIASRCGVFAKSDVVSFLNAGAKREDIAASILQAIVDQTIGGLSCGRPIQGKVAFIGGPLHFLKQLRAHFIKSLNLAEELIANIPQGQFAVAVGAALYAFEEHAKNAKSHLPHSLAEWIRQIKAKPPVAKNSQKLPPLFLNKEEYESFLISHDQQTTPRASLENAVGDLWLGIDLGSTTVKGVLLDDQLRLLASWYGSNSGTPREALVPHVAKLLKEIPPTAKIKGICTTGYGADLAAAILGTSISEVETIAHLKAATYLKPDVGYVIDIGGQDMKCLKTSNGLIEQIKLNEACSSGCGAFIQTFAKSLNLSITEFVQRALFAKNPVDLGTRCTVFMNSRVKQAQKEGASIDDIAAGLCYSVIRNALYKVMRLDPAELKSKEIVVQGGSFLNHALLRVLEKYLGKQVLRPDIAGLMGAFGCALIAKEKVERRHLEAPNISAAALEALKVTTRSFNCKGCSNRCMLTLNRLSSGKKFVSGNRCDFGAKAKSGKKEDTGSELFNLYTWKLRHLFEGEPLPIEKAPRGILGIPRVLNMYEHYPYWFTLFRELGFRIELSPESNKDIFNSGLSSMPSQTVCLPAKLVHGHIAWLSSHGIHRIWFPCVPKEKKFFKEQIDTYSCPVVTGYPEVAKLNLEASERRKLNILSPFLVISNRKSVRTGLQECFPDIPAKEIDHAIGLAEKALLDWHSRLANEAERILSDSQALGKKVIVLAGRPYHVDPFINHGLPTYLESLGVSVVTEDSIVHLAPEPGSLRVINQWSFHSRLYRAAAFAAQEPNVEMVQLTSFGCGIDAITSDQIEEILCKKDKTYTLLKIDEGSAIGQAKIRIASTLATVEERDAKKKNNSATETHKEIKSIKEEIKEAPYYKKSYRKTHTILAPQMSPIHFRLIANVFEYNGYHLDLLPAVSEQAIETGLKYVNNDACYPSIVTIGQLVEALRTGNHDPDTTALMLSQTCGPCRATNYISLLRKALNNAGFPQVPVVSVSGGALNKQPGFTITPLGLRRLSLAVLYGDMIQRLYISTLAHELYKGDAKELLAKWIKRATDVSCWGSTRKFISDLDVMVREFGSVPQDGDLKPKVGIVGEILLKFHPDANKHLAEMVINEGGEPVLTDFADFFLYCMTDSIWEHRHMNGSFFKSKTNELFMAWVETLRAPMRKALYGTGYFPVSDLNDLQDSVSGIVNLGEQAGEGWLLPAEMIAFARHGINNVLCLQPFGCLPNHITGKGVIKALREKFKNFNLMALDFEAGTSEAYISNRVKLFMTVAHEAVSTQDAPAILPVSNSTFDTRPQNPLSRSHVSLQPQPIPIHIYRNRTF